MTHTAAARRLAHLQNVKNVICLTVKLISLGDNATRPNKQVVSFTPRCAQTDGHISMAAQYVTRLIDHLEAARLVAFEDMHDVSCARPQRGDNREGPIRKPGCLVAPGFSRKVVI